MSNVVKLVPEEVGAGYQFDSDEVLRAALEKKMTSIVIIGELPDGELWCSSAVNAGEALVLMEKAKRLICFGE